MASTTRDDLLTADELAAWLKVSKYVLDRQRASGTGPAFVRMNGGRAKGVRYKRSSVEAWLATLERRSTSDTGVGR